MPFSNTQRCLAIFTAPLSNGLRKLSPAGEDVILEIDWQGAAQVRQLFAR